MPLGQPPSVGSEHERHVGVAGRGKAEHPMEVDLTRRRVQEVSPPHHLVYVLHRVVHHDGELVGGGAVVAPHNEVVYLTLIGPKQAILER